MQRNPASWKPSTHENLRLKNALGKSIRKSYNRLVPDENGDFRQECALDVTLPSHQHDVPFPNSVKTFEKCLKVLKESSLTLDMAGDYCFIEAQRKFYPMFFDGLSNNSISLTPLITLASTKLTRERDRVNFCKQENYPFRSLRK
jgi:hypothetical protein